MLCLGALQERLRRARSLNTVKNEPREVLEPDPVLSPLRNPECMLTVIDNAAAVVSKTCRFVSTPRRAFFCTLSQGVVASLSLRVCAF